jgi:molybdopterin/thiamine biosynthesis adenylyltransferase
LFFYSFFQIGIETAKNLILFGAKEVGIHDDEITRIEHLGVNFFLKEIHVGKTSLSEASHQ